MIRELGIYGTSFSETLLVVFLMDVGLENSPVVFSKMSTLLKICCHLAYSSRNQPATTYRSLNRCQIATEFALKYPERVSKLVLILAP